MEVDFKTLRRSEQVAYRMRGIYEQYGYAQFRMGKFEAYDFYTEHRDFLPSGQILTFTDLSGKLMALKPDITMSIIKRTHATGDCPERMYYTESIYRASKELREYREIYQVGLEYIGSVLPPVNAEVITLALRSLACMEDDYVLDVSHMGFITGLMDSFVAPRAVKQELLACIESKNTHELRKLVETYSVDRGTEERLCALIALPGDLEEALPAAKKICCNAVMEAALQELRVLQTSLREIEAAKALRLDFSITLDSKYYNGLMFRGYIQGAPRAVLSGGRYDPLLTRMGKAGLQAIGFGVYFDEVERHLAEPYRAPYDTVVLYTAADDAGAVYAAAEELIAKGRRVFTSTSLPPDAGTATVLQFTGGRLVERA